MHDKQLIIFLTYKNWLSYALYVNSVHAYVGSDIRFQCIIPDLSFYCSRKVGLKDVLESRVGNNCGLIVYFPFVFVISEFDISKHWVIKHASGAFQRILGVLNFNLFRFQDIVRLGNKLFSYVIYSTH